MKTASPDGGEVVDDGADRALAERAPVELPHRAEAAAERTAARRLDEPDGLEEQAVVARCGTRSTRSRAGAGTASRPVRSSSGACRRPAVAPVRRAAPGTSPGERPAASASASAGTTSSPSSTQIASISGTCSGPGNAAAAWPPTRMKASGDARRTSPRGLDAPGRTRARACRRCRPGADASAAIQAARLPPKRRSTIARLVPARPQRRRRRTRGRAARRGKRAPARSARCPDRAGSAGRSSGAPRIVDLSPTWAKSRRSAAHRRRSRRRAAARSGSATASRTASSTAACTTARAGCPWRSLNAINLVGNGLAVTFLTRTKAGMRDNFRSALGVGEARGRGSSRAGSSSSTAATRSTSGGCAARPSCPRITTFDEDAPRPRAEPARTAAGFLLVTGHVGNWEMGAVTLRQHDLVPAVVGQPELDPERAGDAPAAARAPRRRIDRHRLLDGDGVQGPRRRRPRAAPWRCSSTAPTRRTGSSCRSSDGRRPFLRSPALLARFCGCDDPAGLLPAQRRRLLLQRLGRAARAPTRPLSPDEDAVRIMTRVARGPRGRRPRASRRSGSTSTGSGTGSGASARPEPGPSADARTGPGEAGAAPTSRTRSSRSSGRRWAAAPSRASRGSVRAFSPVQISRNGCLRTLPMK